MLKEGTEKVRKEEERERRRMQSLGPSLVQRTPRSELANQFPSPQTGARFTYHPDNLSTPRRRG